jgi:predicted metal-binding membrane protein
MSEASALENLLRRDRAIAIAGLLTLCLFAWLYVIEGAGLGMSAWQMTTLVFFPHQAQDLIQGMSGDTSSVWTPWGLATWTLMTAMWWVMMIAMMTPSAAPAILLYARVNQNALTEGRSSGALAPTGAFAAGYLLVWFGFSAVTASLHWALERSGLVSTMMMGSRSRVLSGSVLIAVGLYQLSPLKSGCLAHCRAPASFLSRHWRPHARGALQLGIRHGAYCVGCCWLLMALLFVGGVMNLIWIAALTIIVLVEKVLRGGQWVGRGVGIVLAGWGAITLMI